MEGSLTNEKFLVNKSLTTWPKVQGSLREGERIKSLFFQYFSLGPLYPPKNTSERREPSPA
jgi:hypothetical protein